MRIQTKRVRMRTHRAAWLASLAMMLVLTAPGWAGEEAVRDGVTHVLNGPKPSKGIEKLELEELWRVGGADDYDNLFGVVVQALHDEAGNIYLLDMQLGEVQVFSPEGEKIKTLSRQGEGPGEVQNPSDMCLLPSGNIGIVQTFPGKLVVIDREGIPVGDILVGNTDPAAGGLRVLIDAKCNGTDLVMSGMAIEQAQAGQNRTNFLASFTEEGKEVTRYMTKETKLDFQNFEIIEKDQYFVFPRRWALAEDGHVYGPPERDAYVINVYAKDGTLERVIEREYENRARSDAETERIRSAIEAQTRQAPFEVKTEICETEPVITSIDLAPDGSIWVNTNRSAFEQPEGVLMTFDVFSPDGHFIKQLQVACEGDGANDGFFMISPDRAILVKGLVSGVMAMQGGLGAGSAGGEEEEAPMEVIYYKVAS